MSVSEKPTIQWVCDKYGLRPTRAGFINCPIHEDREPSCQLHDDWWYCYGCGANGDSIALIAAVTKRPIVDVLRAYTEKVPTWRNRRTVALPPGQMTPGDVRAWIETGRLPGPTTRSAAVRRSYRDLNSWFFKELARRLEGAPDWLLLRAVEWWGEQFGVVQEALVAEDWPQAEGLLRGLAALCERGLDVEQKVWWEYAVGQLVLRGSRSDLAEGEKP